MAWKTMVIRTSPRITGRTPLSPLRIRVVQARNHSPSDWATSSGGTSRVAASVAAVGSGADSGASALARLASISVGTLDGATRGPGGHVVDDALAVEGGGALLDHQPAQVEDRDPVGHLEDVVQVVRDDHHRQTAIAQAPGQVEHHP